jgi:hypothetical protein
MITMFIEKGFVAPSIADDDIAGGVASGVPSRLATASASNCSPQPMRPQDEDLVYFWRLRVKLLLAREGGMAKNEKKPNEPEKSRLLIYVVSLTAILTALTGLITQFELLATASRRLICGQFQLCPPSLKCNSNTNDMTIEESDICEGRT